MRKEIVTAMMLLLTTAEIVVNEKKEADKIIRHLVDMVSLTVN